ncbi:MAG: pyruvate kinase [Nitrososphaerales archaeon]
MQRRTKIVCTIGPATDSAAMLERLARAGMDCARLNFSHGTHAEHLKTIRMVRKLSSKIGREIAILQDLPGPKFRLGNLKNGSVSMKKGSTITLTTEEGDESHLPLRQKDLPKYVTKGSVIFLSDGAIKLKVLNVTDSEIVCLCQNPGQVFSGKGINIPKLGRDFATFTDQDKEHVLFGLDNDVELIAVSFVRNSDDIRAVRKFVRENINKDSEPPWIVAKIEKRDALADIEGITRESNMVMVARGDLGVENPIEQVPIIQKNIISMCNRLGVPVITATQMLESMVVNSSPTRAEVTDVANAILDGTDALMLSEETAVGEHPLDCVKVLNNVALVTEKRLQSFPQRFVYDSAKFEGDVRDSTSGAATKIARDISAKLIVSPTNRGSMTAKISRFRPGFPIIALTESRKTLRKLALVWGVHPLKINKTRSLTGLFEVSINTLVEKKLVNYGDRIVIVCDGIELSRQKGDILFTLEVKHA